MSALDKVLLGVAALAALWIVWMLRHGIRDGFFGPETRSHTPKVGPQPCCAGIGKDDLAEWWFSYGRLTIRLGDGRLYRRYRKDSQHRQIIGGSQWEPYGQEPHVVFAPDPLLRDLEREIDMGMHQERLNVPLNGWHW